MMSFALGVLGGAALTAAAVVAPGAPAASAPAASLASFGLRVVGHANHRRPLPGETQVLRWTVTNTGTQALSRVRLRVSVPGGWRARHRAGCRAAGRRLSCELGGLAAWAHRRTTIRLVVPARPRYGTVRVSAATRAWRGRQAFAGPSASVPLTVVRAR